jgi:glucose-1-phosphate cytidylyltransferase
MKTVILAGGMGTRLSEETDLRPKPLVEIGGRPILWHIMKIYENAGLNEFIVCCGYKGHMIKQYFIDYCLQASDIEVDLERNVVSYIRAVKEKWRVSLIDTGIDTMTGGRIKRTESIINDEPFCLTYGDGVADIDINEVIKCHREHGRKATVTAVPSPGRFGILEMGKERKVTRFHEKPDNEMGWINGGFFVLEPSVFNYISTDDTVWERAPLEQLAAEGELTAYRHTRFWKAMDTLRDKRELDELWSVGGAPWKRWKDA